ncbi:ribonuclease S-4-like [Solanum tuberosum]|uniref:Ribonuclease t2 n=3 Tax=Solanum tuberosum TaxID=4113 RepID=M1CMG4_SOLTU|nr:PREDICTED: ribonuclease S-4-like [Solanum tuberosum]
MKKLTFFLLVILLLEITISDDSKNPALLKFVLQWPPTFCMNLNNDAKQPGRCQEPILQHNLTLHGVWPADQDGISITCCTKPPYPNWDQLFTPTVENQLMAFWPPLRENSQKRDLWMHEWKAHGACGGTTAQVYFNTAIRINNMLQKGNLFNYLKTSGIIACNSLSFAKKDIVDAIRKVFVVTPPSPPLDVYLTCIPIDSRNRTHVYLKEVTLCTNLGGTSFISCPSKSAPKSCSTGATIMLPHPKPQPSLSPPPPPPRRFQEEIDVDGIYPKFEQSWTKYIFNG